MIRALLEDGSLVLEADEDVWSSLVRWMPLIPPHEPAPECVRASIHVERGGPAFGVPGREPPIQLLSVSGWPDPRGQVLLCDPERRISAVIDPPAHRATVRLLPPEDGHEAFQLEVFAALTLAAAFLLGRLDRTLVHAGAAVAPDGRAWLLVGGTFSGKSTTCVNLIRSGWDWLADDNVLLRPAADGILVEGWPRRFNLDHGYERGRSQGVRSRVDPGAFGPGRWRRTAALGGLLFPRVEAELPTAVEPMPVADAFSELLQQSPWLLADPGTAPDVLKLLQRAARMPAFQLRLGADSYRDTEHLRAVLASAVAPPSGEFRTPGAGEFLTRAG